MHGGHQVHDLLKMTKREFLFWYKLHEREIIRESIIEDHIKREKPIPSTKRLESMIDKKIQELKEEL